MKMPLPRLKSFLFLIITSVLFTSSANAFMGGLRWKGTFESELTDIKWEYKVVALTDATGIADGSFEQELNNLGTQGWELETVVLTQSSGYYIMKKPSNV